MADELAALGVFQNARRSGFDHVFGLRQGLAHHHRRSLPPPPSAMRWAGVAILLAWETELWEMWEVRRLVILAARRWAIAEHAATLHPSPKDKRQCRGTLDWMLENGKRCAM